MTKFLVLKNINIFLDVRFITVGPHFRYFRYFRSDVCFRILSRVMV